MSDVYWMWFPSRKIVDISLFLKDLNSENYEIDFAEEELPTIEGWYQVLFDCSTDVRDDDPTYEGAIIYEGDSRMWSGPMFLSRCPSVLRIVLGCYENIVRTSIPDVLRTQSQHSVYVDSSGGLFGNETSAFVVQAFMYQRKSLPNCAG